MTNNEKNQENLSKEIKSNNNKETSETKKLEPPDYNKENRNQNISQNEQKQNNADINNQKINNDNPEANKLKERNETINQFIYEIENKNKENKENPKTNKKEDEESDDPFSKAENEYRKKNVQIPNNIGEKEIKENIIKSEENLRYKKEKDNNKSKSKNKISKDKEKEWIQKLIYNHFKKGLNIKKIKTRL